jgi:hypothetical protein
MRRVLLIMPLLVVLVACGGSSTQPANGSGLSTLTRDEVESKIVSSGLCKSELKFREKKGEDEVGGWYCLTSSKGSKPTGIAIIVANTRQRVRDDVEDSCQSRNDDLFAWAYGENWFASSPFDPDPANIRKVAKTLGGAVAVDLSDLCKKFGF